MQKSKYLLISDMDGTLLNKEHFVSYENQQAILKFIKLGGHFALATGRAVCSVTRFAGPLRVNYAITCGGALIHDFIAGGITSLRPMPPESRRLADELFAADAGISLQIYTPQSIHLLLDNEIIRARGVPEEYSGLISPREFLPEIWCKMIMTGLPEQMDALKERVNSGYPGLCAFKSGRHFCEVTAKGVDKGSALLELCKIYGIPPEHTAVAGDNGNDLPMLRECALPMAVENAPESVKDQVEHILPSNEKNPLVRAVELALHRFKMQ